VADDVAISLDSISVAYGKKVVLHDISTQIKKREITVILGTSGCGKTTLLKTIIGLIKPKSGSVKLFGENLTDPDTAQGRQLLSKIGVLFQNGAMLGSLTVAQNVALPLSVHSNLPQDIIDQIVQLKLAQVHLSHAAESFPGELSGGMKKRAALARALALDPPLLFCDEPSAGLDPVTAAGLDQLLLSLKADLGITIVIVTHELLSIESIADSILFLNKGNLLFDGPYKEARKIEQGPIKNFFDRKESEQT